jgi:hypothetical protein
MAFDDLIAVELVNGETSLHKTNRGSQVAGVAVGGLLLGPAGLIIGGLSGSGRQETRTRKLSIKIYTSDIFLPVHEVFFVDAPGTGVDTNAARQWLADADQWYGRLRAILEQNRTAAA